MKTLLKYFALVLLLPMMALAHQPRIVESATTVVIDPEISKAYYAELSGAPQIYTIEITSGAVRGFNTRILELLGGKK